MTVLSACKPSRDARTVALSDALTNARTVLKALAYDHTTERFFITREQIDDADGMIGKLLP